MNILVINSGSTSLKYQLINTQSYEVLKKGTFERVSDHNKCVKEMFEQLGAEIKIDAIGHRVVHGGEVFKQSTKATEENLKEVEALNHLAPLHNPANVIGIHACMKTMPNIPNVMVFDTAFHSAMPKAAFLYGLPISDYEKHSIRRYGFHGTSHDYVSKTCAEMYGKPREDLRIITVHLGGGCSVCAVDKGVSVDTSMGLTPLEGIIMETRSGDIDPGALGLLAKVHGFDMDQTINYLNKEGGRKGLSGGSGNMQDMDAAALAGDKNAQIAIEVFAHRVTKYIGAYAAIMGGVDAIVWTGGIGNNNGNLRKKVMGKLAFLGAEIDEAKNIAHTDPYIFRTGEISAEKSTVRTFVIKTDEEKEIAIQTESLCGSIK